MARRLAVGFAAAAVFATAAAPSAAQAPLAVSILLPAAARRTVEGPLVTVSNIFADRRSEELLSSGFVARMAVTVELWRSQTWFDHLVAHQIWERVVRFDPVRKAYRFGRRVGDSVVEEGQRASLDSVRAVMMTPQRTSLTAPHGERGLYYTVTVTVETLNSDDLDEVKRWLSGDVQPAMRGERPAASMFTRGFGTLFSRLMGGDTKRATHSTGKFNS